MSQQNNFETSSVIETNMVEEFDSHVFSMTELVRCLVMSLEAKRYIASSNDAGFDETVEPILQKEERAEARQLLLSTLRYMHMNIVGDSLTPKLEYAEGDGIA